MCAPFSSMFGWWPQPDQDHAKDEPKLCTVYHCTLKESAESILRTGFRFPTSEDAQEKGLKAGAAVYFGEDPDYCVKEALNSLAGDDEGDRASMRPKLALIEAQVKLGRSYSLGNYHDAVTKGYGDLTVEDFENYTADLTKEHLKLFGYDSITLNEGTEKAEVAIFDPEAIVVLKIVEIGTRRSQLVDPSMKCPQTIPSAVKCVYHCTLKENAENIVNTGFRFPSTDEAQEKGLKAGAAVHFGEDAEYCFHKALNSLAGDEESDRAAMRPNLRIIEAQVVPGRAFSLSNHHEAVTQGFKGLSTEVFEDLTACLSRQRVKLFGYDSIILNEGSSKAEVAIFEPHRITNLKILD